MSLAASAMQEVTSTSRVDARAEGGPVEDGGVVGEREAAIIARGRGHQVVLLVALVRRCGEVHQGHEGGRAGVGRGLLSRHQAW